MAIRKHAFKQHYDIARYRSCIKCGLPETNEIHRVFEAPTPFHVPVYIQVYEQEGTKSLWESDDKCDD